MCAASLTHAKHPLLRADTTWPTISHPIPLHTTTQGSESCN